jgi:hypothetical protein
MSMWRRFVRRGAPILTLLLVLGLPLPQASGTGDWDFAGRIWSWLVGVVWSADGAGSGGTYPNGTTGDDDRGLGMDPDGLTTDGDRGLGIDPDGES